ncbi:MAG: phosphoethanolamine transferase [Planctomycetota bacterium]
MTSKAPLPGRTGVRSTWAAFAVAGYLTSVGNLALWRAVHSGPAALSWPSIVALFLSLLTLYTVLLQFVALPWLFKPIAALLLLFSGLTTFAMLEYGILIDAEMFANVFRTDSAEAGEFLTAKSLLSVLILGGVPATLLTCTRLRHGRPWPEFALRSALAVGLLGASVATVWPNYKELSITVREHPSLKLLVNPINPLTGLFVHLGESQPGQSSPFVQIATDATRPPGSTNQPRLILVLVVGETATASHFSLNGYARPTNPELEQRDILNFPDVTACGTSTAVSVPCLFSALPRADFSRQQAAHSENLLDVLQRVGVNVLWRDNNSGSQGVADRVPFERIAGPESFRNEAEFYDEALLEGLQEHFDSQAGDLLIVLHQKGSHGPAYSRRSPPAFKRFLPECAALDVQECPQDELVNAYDNTILYTDHVLARLIDLLAANSLDARVAMLYVSDHGESLGEKGIYLHGFPYWLAPEQQRQVPMVFWASPELYASLAASRDELRSLALRAFSHDNIFHTLLGIFGVQSASYDPELDIFAGSAGKH